MIFISALSGQRVSKLFAHIREVAATHALRIPTGKLNAFLKNCVDAMSPHMVEGKLPRLYYMVQVGMRPPSFVIKTNTDRGLHFSYVRYLENRLREVFGFIGTPIRLSIQKKQKGDEAPLEEAKVRRILDPGEGLKPGFHNEAFRGQKAEKAKPKVKRKVVERPKPATKQAPKKGRAAPPKRARQKSLKRG